MNYSLIRYCQSITHHVNARSATRSSPATSALNNLCTYQSNSRSHSHFHSHSQAHSQAHDHGHTGNTHHRPYQHTVPDTNTNTQSIPSSTIQQHESQSSSSSTYTLPPLYKLSYPHTVELYDYTNRLIPYSQYLQWQQTLIKRRTRQMKEYNNDISQLRHNTSSSSMLERLQPDKLILLQHPPVYTLGRASTINHLKFPFDSPPSGTSIYRIDRGGEVTYHNEGQLVMYPILNLTHYIKSLHTYIRYIEQWGINILQKHYGLHAYREPSLTGVWCNNKKIAAIGLNASRWITSHGIALNVNNDLEGFTKIVPCGIEDKEVTSLQLTMDELKNTRMNDNSKQTNVSTSSSPHPPITIDTVKQLAIHEFQELFNVKCIPMNTDDPTME